MKVHSLLKLQISIAINPQVTQVRFVPKILKSLQEQMGQEHRFELYLIYL